MRNRYLRVAVALVFLVPFLTISTAVEAQTVAGTLQGTVTDTSGSPLPGATPVSGRSPLSGATPVSRGTGGTSIGVPASIGPAVGQVPRCDPAGREMFAVGRPQLAQISPRAGYESATPV